ncbi:estradiol 17-beta-dehydrogenase 8-like [Acipenser oxyrinchus oxyrinchus]|uniref:Estradiol 17-beta-dehydrogenase 8-like n=1 Tax=Acipenser oxyrinchus oxyrinchus TaxID=40147 RepID=A0AAD8CQQ2_ACIOX|nr:estradiol 17-beta-dehydrogenase 8-like [Acipenser oxyrinchus oxyrinchus]
MVAQRRRQWDRTSVCQRFARDGASVVVADISEDSANEALGILSHDLQGQEHAALCVGVSSRQSVEQLIKLIQVQDRQGNTSGIETSLYTDRAIHQV